MLENDVINQVKKDLGITDDSRNVVIEKYYKEVNKQITEHLGNTGRTSTLKFIEKSYVVSKMKYYKMEYSPKVERETGLDHHIKDNDDFMGVLKSYRGLQGANNRNIRAITERRQQRGIKNDYK